jgi:hypothetical protein
MCAIRRKRATCGDKTPPCQFKFEFSITHFQPSPFAPMYRLAYS